MAKGSGGVDHDAPHDLNRFVSAQEGVYDRVLAEVRGGLKRTHWMWFIFPQTDGLGHSPTRNKTIIDDVAKYGYTQQQIAAHLNLHYSTISNLVRGVV